MAKKTVELKTADSTDGVDKCDVTGFESVVPQIRDIDDQIAKLLEKKTSMKDLILSRVKELKKEQESAGVLYKSFVILSTDDQPALVLFKNQFKKLDVTNEEAMRKVLNGKFDELFEETEDVKLKKKFDMEAMRKILGDKFDTFFSTTKHLAFRSNYMEQRAVLRKKMGKRQNAVVDKWTVDAQASPDLRMKGK